MTNFVQWWLTPKFPQKHIDRIYSYKPEGLKNQIRNFYRTWLVHPIKRRIAKHYLVFLRTFFGLKVIGITGSAGKTSTKEMLAAILKLEGETIYSFANIDPIYNIPTTLLRCKPSTRFLVLEMGVEYRNEMDFYLWLVKPDVGVITNIYPTHTLFFKNVDGVYKEKSKLVKGISKTAYAVLNSESTQLRKLEDKLKSKVIWHGGASSIKSSPARFMGDFKTRFTLKIDGASVDINLPVLGKQFVENALAAAASAKALEISNKKIKKGLESFKLQDHRMNVRKLRSGAILVDDSYNNNPEAARKAIDMLKDLAGNKKTILVFGDMLELGKDEVKYHKEIMSIAKRKKIDCIIGIGQLSQNVVSGKRYWAEGWEKAVPVVKQLLGKNVIVLVKGSRSIGLDRLVEALD